MSEIYADLQVNSDQNKQLPTSTRFNKIVQLNKYNMLKRHSSSENSLGDRNVKIEYEQFAIIEIRGLRIAINAWMETRAELLCTFEGYG